MEPDWADRYYEALEFFYWEPQHIGRKKHTSAQYDTVEKVKPHLRRIETTLNHLLTQLFALAPGSLRNALFAELFRRPFARPFALYGREMLGKLDLEQATQPDLLFVSGAEVVSVEMKVGAKCSPTQVLKYALLGLALELRAGATRRHCLTLLGRGEFADQWNEPFLSTDDLRCALADTDLDSFLRGQRAPLPQHEERLRAIVADMELEFIHYGGLAAFLLNARPPASDESDGAQVYRNLIDGMVAELGRRGLLDDRSPLDSPPAGSGSGPLPL